MLANNNLKVCRTLVRREVKFHPVKYVLLSCAAMLVAALYTFVFLLGSSVEDAYLLSCQYSYGSTSHILYTGLTEKQADTLAGNSNIKSTVRLSTIGRLSDPIIGQRNIKLAVTDRAYAKTVWILLAYLMRWEARYSSTGQIPREKNIPRSLPSVDGGQVLLIFQKPVPGLRKRRQRYFCRIMMKKMLRM